MLGFHWILSNELAGSPQPGLYGDWDEQIQYLKNLGIDYVMSLTEEPLIKDQLKKEDFGFIHLPIRDMDAPLPRLASPLIHKMKKKINKGHKFLIHCKGGVGRTGMVAACYLVLKGVSAQDAITKVRTIHPPYIQTSIQEKFVIHFEMYEKSLNS